MTHRNIGAKNLFGVACALALIASGCSLSSTASDSTTTLPSVTTPSSSDVASSDDSASTSDAVQSAAERYGTDVETTTPPTLTDADTITTAGLGPVRIGHTPVLHAGSRRDWCVFYGCQRRSGANRYL